MDVGAGSGILSLFAA
jgi:type I protein arginine methyltransferase